MPIQREQLVALLQNKDFRGHFASDQIHELLAVQVRQLREKHRWTQAELGAEAGMQQVQVSRVEDSDYTGSKISTLSRLARAFDVALIVRFAPFSELADWIAKLSPESFEPAGFTEDLAQLGCGVLETRASALRVSADGPSNVSDIDTYRSRRWIAAQECEAPLVAYSATPKGEYQHAST